VLFKQTCAKTRGAAICRNGVPDEARERLQDRIARLPSVNAPAVVPKVRRPEWVKPEIVVRVRHLQGGDTLRHASVQGLVK